MTLCPLCLCVSDSQKYTVKPALAIAHNPTGESYRDGSSFNAGEILEKPGNARRPLLLILIKIEERCRSRCAQPDASRSQTRGEDTWLV